MSQVNTNDVLYTGKDLPTIGIRRGTTISSVKLTIILEKLELVLASFSSSNDIIITSATKGIVFTTTTGVKKRLTVDDDDIITLTTL